MERLTAALADRYRIERELGAGGMATVYLAEDLKHDRKVAVKVLRADLAASLGPERFLREVKIAANLQHPHVLPLYDSGQADGFLYYVMPYVEGTSLRQKLIREGELPIPDAVRILRDVADALAYAHQHGVVHRDIKPENVMLSGRHALVTDFGVAKAVSEATGRQTLTTAGVALGTPAYMAPEQAAADPHTDHRADIYAFGVVAYELLTGRPPFTGASPQAILAAHVTTAADPVTKFRASIPPALAALVMRCLEKKPADRWQSADEIIPQLEAVLTPSGGMTPTATQPVAALAFKAGRRSLTAITGTVAVLAALVGIWLFLQRPAGSGLDPKMVTVLPFENRTGDSAFSALGQNLAERVTRGLSETGTVELVGDAGGTGTSKRPGTVVAGSVYRRGDSVEITGTISELPGRLVLRTVGPLHAAANRPEPAIDELVQRVMGGVAMMFDQTYGSQGTVSGQPPTYDAYRKYRAGEEHSYAFRWDSAVAQFRSAIRADSGFVFARLRIVHALYDATDLNSADSALATVEARRSRLTPFEEAYAGYLRARLQGDWAGQLAAGERMHRAAPRSDAAAYYHAIAAGLIGRPLQVLEILGPLDPQGPMLNGRVYYFGYITTAHHLLGDYSKELQVAERGRRQYPDRLIVRQDELRALAALGRVDGVRAALAEALTLRTDGLVSMAEVFLTTARELRAHGYGDASVGVLESLLEWLAARPEADARLPLMRWARAQALELLGRLDEAAGVADSLSGEQREAVNYLGIRGLIAARRGNRAAAEALADSLANLKTAFMRGSNTAWRAGITAALGDRPRAVQLLSQAIAQGYSRFYTSDAEAMFENLRDDPQFQQLRRPRN